LRETLHETVQPVPKPRSVILTLHGGYTSSPEAEVAVTFATVTQPFQILYSKYDWVLNEFTDHTALHHAGQSTSSCHVHVCHGQILCEYDSE